MAQERPVDIERVTSAMDATRQSIRETVGELKERVQETTDWRRQVARRPITSLCVAVVCGVAGARVLTHAVWLAFTPPVASRTTGIARLASTASGAAGPLRYIVAALGLVNELPRLRSFLSQVRRLGGTRGLLSLRRKR
jgi:hypothetical protein